MSKKKPSLVPPQVAPPPTLTSDEQEAVIKKYIAFRRDPTNDQFEDSLFCSENSVGLDTLKMLKNTDTMRRINNSPYTDKQLRCTVDHLLRQTNQILTNGEHSIPVKSLEGLLNAFTNLIKQQQLIRGKPTERIAVEDLRKKEPAELHRYLMGQLKGMLSRN